MEFPEALEYHGVDLRQRAGNEDLVIGWRLGPDDQFGHARHGSVRLRNQHDDAGSCRTAEQFLEVAPDRGRSGTRWPPGSSAACRSPLAVRSCTSAGTSSARAVLIETVTPSSLAGLAVTAPGDSPLSAYLETP